MSRRARAQILVLGMGIWFGLVSLPANAHPQHCKYKRLVRKGVKIAVLGQVIRFRGLVRGGAPLVVDFELARDGYLELEIKTKNVRRLKTLRFPAKAGVREIAVQKLPVDFDVWQTGRLTVSAFDDSGQETDYRFFGIGVGERAVGSTGIYQVTFEPSVIRKVEPSVIRATESAAWGFRAKHDFERAGVVVYRWHDDAGYWQESRSLDTPCLPERGKRCEGNWDGNDGEGTLPPGPHLVAVKAWQSEHDKDWIFAISEEEVEVK